MCTAVAEIISSPLFVYFLETTNCRRRPPPDGCERLIEVKNATAEHWSVFRLIFSISCSLSCCSPTLPNFQVAPSRTLLFLQKLPRSVSGSPLLATEHSPLLALSCMELSVGGYFGTVSGDFPHSTRDVSIHWIVSLHSTRVTFFVSTRLSTGWPKK